MNRLETALEPGEEVAGRWQGPAGPIVLLLLAAYAAMVSIVWIFGHIAIPSESTFREALPLLAFLAPVPVLVTGLARLEDFGRGLHVLLTERRLIWKEGTPPVTRVLVRDSIASVTAYEGSGTVHLLLHDGVTVRISGLVDPLAVARSLDCPGEIWRRPPDAEQEGWYRSLAVISVAVTSAATSLLLSALLLLLEPESGIWPTPYLLGLVVFVIVGIAFFSATNLMLTGIVAHIIAAKWFEREKLRCFACRQLCRRCAGREPIPEGGGGPWNRIESLIDDWLIRRLYGGTLECDCGPEFIGPRAN